MAGLPSIRGPNEALVFAKRGGQTWVSHKAAKPPRRPEATGLGLSRSLRFSVLSVFSVVNSSSRNRSIQDGATHHRGHREHRGGSWIVERRRPGRRFLDHRGTRMMAGLPSIRGPNEALVFAKRGGQTWGLAQSREATKKTRGNRSSLSRSLRFSVFSVVNFSSRDRSIKDGVIHHRGHREHRGGRWIVELRRPGRRFLDHGGARMMAGLPSTRGPNEALVFAKRGGQSWVSHKAAKPPRRPEATGLASAGLCDSRCSRW